MGHLRQFEVATYACRWPQEGKEFGNEAEGLIAGDSGGRRARRRVPMIRTTGIDHVHLHVSDVERAADFYREVLGAEEAFRVGDRLVFMSLPERRVVITLDGRPEDERNPMHVGFALAEG